MLYTDGLVERPGEVVDEGVRRLTDALGAVEPRCDSRRAVDALVEQPARRRPAARRHGGGRDLAPLSGVAFPHPRAGVPTHVIAITTLLLVVMIGLLITRFATAALVATGLSRESARFQARSAFTGAGFTTAEAETVVSHPVRRRVVMFLMLAGNAGIALVAVGLLLGFGGAEGASSAGLRVAVLVAGLVAIFFLARNEWFDRRLRSALGRVLSQVSDIEVRDYAQLLHVAGDYVIDELAVEADDWMCHRTLGELRLRDEGVVVLGVERSGTYIGTPGSETELEALDVLLVYGRAEVIEELDRRRSDPAGQFAHALRAGEQRRLRGEEAARLDASADRSDRGATTAAADRAADHDTADDHADDDGGSTP